MLKKDDTTTGGLSDDLYSWAWETLVWKLKKWFNYIFKGERDEKSA